MIIAIDGPANVGKSAAGSELARTLSVDFVSSGSVYRAIAAAFLDAYGTSLFSPGALEEAVSVGLQTLLSADAESLRSREVTAAASSLASEISVREYVNRELRMYCAERNVVVDGRDMAEVLDPDFAFLLTASFEDRVRLLADNREISYEAAAADLEERDSHQASRAHDWSRLTPIQSRPGELQSVVARMAEVVRAGSLGIRSRWEGRYCGPLPAENLQVSPSGAVASASDRPAPMVFADSLNYATHSCLAFLEQYLPYCEGCGDLNKARFLSLEGVDIVLRSGRGYLVPSRGRDRIDHLMYPDPPECALCTSETGLRFLEKSGAWMVSLRAEFFLRYNYSEEMRDRLLHFACESFATVFFRLFDNSPETGVVEIEAQRGLPYMRGHWDGFVGQLELAKRFRDSYGNVSVLVPYLRSDIEVEEAMSLIRGHYAGPVAMMIEVPLMLYLFSRYANVCDDFVIGMGDLTALVGGVDRASAGSVGTAVERFVVELIIGYVLPHLKGSQRLFITSARVVDQLRDHVHMGKVHFLAKY